MNTTMPRPGFTEPVVTARRPCPAGPCAGGGFRRDGLIALILVALGIPTWAGPGPEPSRLASLRAAGRYAEATEAARSTLDAKRHDPSSSPWEIADAVRLVETLEEMARLPEPARRELAGADRLLADLQGRPEKLLAGDELAALERMVEVRARHLGESHPEVADLLLAVAPSVNLAGDTGRAETQMRRALEIRRSRMGPDHPAVIEALLVLADHCLEHYQLQEAEELAAKALETTRRLFGEGHEDAARALAIQGQLASGEDHGKALELYERALGIQRDTLGDEHLDTAATLVLLGDELHAGGKAVGERYLREALAIQRRRLGPDSITVADTLNTLAERLRWLGEHHEAIDLYQEAGEIYAKLLGEDHYSVGLIANNVAMAYRSLGDYEAARPLLVRAVALYARAFGSDHPWTKTVRANLALNQANRGDLEAAERTLRGMLSDWDEAAHGSSGFVRLYLARVLEKRGDYAGAEALLRTRLAERLEQDGTENTAGASTLLETLGRLRAAQGDLEGAEDLFTRSARVWEAARGTAGAGTKAATFKQSPYEYLAVVRLERGEPESAWPAVERARGRVLADLLLPSSSGSEAAAPYRLAQIQAAVPEGTALVGWLDFRLHLKAPRFWAYVIRHEGPVQWARLPRGNHDSIEELAAELRDFQHALASVADSSLGAGPAPRKEAHRLWSTRFAPLEPFLEGVDRLVVIPSWAMGGIPLEALLDASGRFLGERFAVSYAVSATTHAWLATAGRRPGAGPRTALLIGDPPFRPEHLAEWTEPPGVPGGRPTVEVSALRSSLRGDREALGRLPRLPWSRREVQGIADVFQRPVVLTGAGASEPALARLVSEKGLGRFDVVHLATHTLMDNERPERSGLVLSQVAAPGAEGPIPADGVITGSEILEHWKLDAELVTLSACQTALGRNIHGEGVVGLSYPFLRAGARALLVSLWKVDDEATALLMQRFYRLWLGEDEGSRGMPKSEALAGAKRFLREHTDASGARPYQHPFYWSAFVLVGDPG